MNQTIEKLTINAFAGDLEAQFELAQRYAVGNEVRQNNAEAVKWYRKAAEQDYADAQFELARCYDTGCGVRKNDVEAAKWYRKAAEQGHGEAQVAFASCCEMGKGVKADLAEALKWLSLAEDSGFGQEHDLSAFAKYSDPVQSSIMAYERSITKQEPAQKPVIQKTEPKDILDGIADRDPLANLRSMAVRRTSKVRGTKLFRIWKGKQYEVMVGKDGKFIFDGETYKSLSAVARKITGTKWNGKTFFGVTG